MYDEVHLEEATGMPFADIILIYVGYLL